MFNGLFTISLDFELHWGVFDSFGNEYQQNLKGAREAIPKILEQFVEHEIHATWACVGFLLAKSKEEIKKWSPDEKKQPAFKNKKYSAYQVDIGKNEKTDLIHFAHSLVNQIKSVKGQEIATHTFSHYYCLEKGQSFEQFEADIKAAVKSAKTLNIDLKSIVFPRNQINQEYLPILKKYGITSYRGTEPARIYDANNTKKYNRISCKVLRLMDSYVNITGYETHDLNSLALKSSLLNIPGSRFLRPYNPKLSFLESLKLRRVKKSMEYAAKNNQLYHLWWHPHNFGVNIEENISMLNAILSYYKLLSDEYGMQSLTMNEIAEEYKD